MIDLKIIKETLAAVEKDLARAAHEPEHAEDKSLLLVMHRDVAHALFVLAVSTKEIEETE